MLKILLLSPPKFDFYFTPARKEPLGLLFIKSAIEKIDDVIVDLYDTTISGKKKKMAIPQCFDYLKEIYPSDKSYFSLFSNYYRFGDSFNKIISQISKKNYDIVAISAQFSGYYPDIEDLICRIKNETRAIVVIGGWAVSTENEDLFSSSRADYFLLGDGEDNFPAFINAFQGNTSFREIPGIIYKDNSTIFKKPKSKNHVISNEFPKRCGKYLFNRKRIASVVLSKGCLYKCAFCAVHRDRKFSIRTLKSIDDELNYLLNLGVEIVDFEDDNLFYSKKFSYEFLSLLKQYHKKGLKYAAMNGITAKNILPFVDQIIDAGFIELNMSLVTSDTKLSNSFHRPFDLEIIKEIVNKINNRVPTLVFLILGLPGSSPDNVLKDILELSRLPVLVGVSPLYLIPGVPLFEDIGIPSDRRLLRGSALYKFGNSFSREDVASLWKFVRMINQIKKTGDILSEEDDENSFYFRKSLKEKRWYRKDVKGMWKKSFKFKVDLPVEFEVCKTGN